MLILWPTDVNTSTTLSLVEISEDHDRDKLIVYGDLSSIVSTWDDFLQLDWKMSSWLNANN